MSKFVEIMDMKFVKGTEPDFASIRMINTKPNNAREYVLLNADKDKLNKITNAGSGSMAYCTDTKELLMYNETDKTWHEV